MRRGTVARRCALLLALAPWCASAQELKDLRFPVHASTPGERRAPAVSAATKGGGFVVAWEEPATPRGPARIVLRRFDGAGEPLGRELTIEGAGASVSQPVVATTASDGLIVAWKEEGAIKVRKLGGPGVGASATLTVTSCCAGGFDLAAEEGGFVVVWEKIPSSSSHSTVITPTLMGQRRRWQRPLTPLEKPRILVEGLNGDSFGEPVPPRLARTVDEKLLVSWQRGGVKGDVFLHAYDANWDRWPLLLPPADLQRPSINYFRAGLQRRPAVAAATLGDLRVVWESGPPVVHIDLALCLNGGTRTEGSGGGSGLDSLALALDGVASALEERRATPADGTLRLSILRFGNGAIETLVGGRPGEPGAEIPDPEAAVQLAAQLRGLQPPREGQEGSAARCLCAAAKLLTGEDPCPPSDRDLCSIPPQGPVPPAAAEGERKVILLATGSLALRIPPVSPFSCEPTATEATCQLSGAARLLQRHGVTTVNAVRLPDSGAELELLSACAIAPNEVPRVDLGSAVFPARPGGERGFVSEALDSQGLVRAFGRTLAAEEGADSGIFARLFSGGGSSAPEIQVNSSVRGDQSAPDVALGAQDTALVVWEDRHNGRIAAQLFGRGGGAIGGEMEVSARVASASRPRIAALGPGRFVVVWEQVTAIGEPSSVWARVLTLPSGQARGRQ